MKKFVFSLLLMATTFIGFAQNCVIDANVASSPGIYPPAPGFIDSTGLVFMPFGVASDPYDQTAQIKVPKDTIVDTLGFQLTVTIDSMKIHSIDNLPPGLTYVCDNSDCFWLGDANGCVKISGVIDSSAGGMNFNVAVKTVGYGTMPILGNVVDTFFFNMQIFVQPQTFSAEELQPFSLKSYPNPAKSFIVIETQTFPIGTPIRGNLTTLSGAKVLAIDESVTGAELIVNVAALPSGMYQLVLQIGDAVLHKKVVVQK